MYLDDYIAVGASWVVTKLLVKSELPDLERNTSGLQPATEPATSRVKYSAKMRYESRRCIHLVKTGPRASFPRYTTYSTLACVATWNRAGLVKYTPCWRSCSWSMVDAALNNNFSPFKFIFLKFLAGFAGDLVF